MVKDIEEANRKLKGWFPRLKTDGKYRPTSNRNVHYNCIAWAMRLGDRWVDVAVTAGHWWPLPLTPDSSSMQGLIDAFKSVKFVECDNAETEFGYDKVALYYNPLTMSWSHAARVISPDEFHSKIGNSWDIHHGSGDVMHNPKLKENNYGFVYKFMKRHKLYRMYSLYLSAKLLGDKISNEVRCLL